MRTWMMVLVVAMGMQACVTLGLQDRYPLITAAENGDRAAAEVLLKQNAEVNAIGEKGRFALRAASAEGHSAIVELLIENGAEVNLANPMGKTALMAAASGGHEAAAAHLIDNGAELEVTDQNGFSALHLAVQGGHADLVDLLIDKGAPVDFSDDEKNKEASDYFPDDKKNTRAPLFLAIDNNKTAIAKKLVTNGAAIDATDSGGNTALHAAAGQANHELVALLIREGADVSAKNDQGAEPFLTVAGSDLHTIINNLYDRVKNSTDDLTVKYTDEGMPKRRYNLFALERMMENYHPEYSGSSEKNKVFDALQYSTLAIEVAKDQFRSKASQLQKDYRLTAQALLDAGADADATDKHQQTALMRICGQGCCVSEMFSEKLIPLSAGFENRFDIAVDTAKTVQKQLLKQTIAAGADVDQRDRRDKTALMAACENGHSEYAALLQENGATVNCANAEGWTPLIYAVSNEDAETVELLLAAGADVNAANDFGETALLKAVYRNNETLVAMLLEKGAKVGIENINGDSPLGVAKNKGYSEIVGMLEEQSALR
ncbi:MAG: ankyrin repeat domain-containing protein [Thermodesulfobacteriota bacterium]